MPAAPAGKDAGAAGKHYGEGVEPSQLLVYKELQ